jgi:hypothetical protein
MMVVANATTDWTTAIGTVVAAVGTVGTLPWGLFLFREGRNQRSKDDLIHQATLISAWSEPIDPSSPQFRRVRLRNGSDSPVYEVNVYLRPKVFARGAEHTFARTVMPPHACWETQVTRIASDAGSQRCRPFKSYSPTSTHSVGFENLAVNSSESKVMIGSLTSCQGRK